MRALGTLSGVYLIFTIFTLVPVFQNIFSFINLQKLPFGLSELVPQYNYCYCSTKDKRGLAGRVQHQNLPRIAQKKRQLLPNSKFIYSKKRKKPRPKNCRKKSCGAEELLLMNLVRRSRAVGIVMSHKSCFKLNEKIEEIFCN